MQLFSGLKDALRERILGTVRGKTVCLPESDDPRVAEAGKLLQAQCGVQVMGRKSAVAEVSEVLLYESLAETARKRNKPLPQEHDVHAHKLDALVVAGAALHSGLCHAVVAGATAETARVIRASLLTVGLAPGVKTLTSAFVMNLQQPTAGGQNPLIFADAGVVPDPTPEQLADIALLSARAFEVWFAERAYVGLLSYSTMGSASGPAVNKVVQALARVQQTDTSLAVVGELQLDAAVVPEVAVRKIPPEARGKVPPGCCNVLVFPDLNSGNIAYKAVERLGGASAWGPVLLGAAKPYADLSRGCSALDIVHVSCLALALS